MTCERCNDRGWVYVYDDGIITWANCDHEVKKTVWNTFRKILQLVWNDNATR